MLSLPAACVNLLSVVLVFKTPLFTWWNIICTQPVTNEDIIAHPLVTDQCHAMNPKKHMKHGARLMDDICICFCFRIKTQFFRCCFNMELAADYTADLFSDPDMLQNDSFFFNMTAANTSSIYTVMSPIMDKTINVLLVVVLFITMVSLGCTMEVSKIKVILFHT